MAQTDCQKQKVNWAVYYLPGEIIVHTPRWSTYFKCNSCPVLFSERYRKSLTYRTPFGFRVTVRKR